MACAGFNIELFKLTLRLDSTFAVTFDPGLVSVIIPTYNRVHLLSEAISSVVGQDYRPIEIIVVDDGSTDNTRKLVSNWAKEIEDMPGLVLRYKFQNNLGAPAARNHGMRLCHGEFIQFLDSDDYLCRAKIGLQIDGLQACLNVDFAYGPIKELENPQRTIYCQTEMSLLRMVYKQIVNPAFQTSGPLCRRSMFAKIGPWREDIAPMEDWELFSRAAVMGCLGVYSSHAIVYHRMQVSDRLRWSGEKERLDQYYFGRFAHLESMLSHASPSFLEDRKFRSLIAWQLMRVASEGVINGWGGDYTRRLNQAHRVTVRGLPALVARSAVFLHRLCGKYAAAFYCLSFPWFYFRYHGLKSRLNFVKRDLAGAR